MQKGIDTINAFGRLAAERMGVGECPEDREWEWRDDLAAKRSPTGIGSISAV